MQEVRAWLVDRQDRLTRQWPTQALEHELRQLQGESRVVQDLLRVIDDGPKIKPTT